MGPKIRVDPSMQEIKPDEPAPAVSDRTARRLSPPDGAFKIVRYGLPPPRRIPQDVALRGLNHLGF
jgi:hypothetical protein